MRDDIISKVRAFNRFYTSAIGVTNQHILESDFSLTEVRAMYEIYNQPGITARHLLTLVPIDEGYLSRLLSKLVSQTIITKLRSKEDNRSFALFLSAKGEGIFLALDKRSSEAVADIIGHLDKAKQRELTQLLGRIINLLTQKQDRYDAH